MRTNHVKEFQLPNVGDARKSFYGKAVQKEDANGIHLLSYGYNICTIDNNGDVHIHTEVEKWDSPTSLRHLKSFLLFNGKEVGSKKELIDKYCRN